MEVLYRLVMAMSSLSNNLIVDTNIITTIGYPVKYEQRVGVYT